MAYLQSRRNKEGQVVSYSIRVYKGRDPRTGKQLTPYTMTWRVPEGWSEKRARKEAEKQAAVFEKQCREGYLADGRQTFAQYAAYVLELKERTGLKHLTLIHYRQSLKRVLPFLGHLKLGEIRPQHLNYVYQQLSLPEAREDNEMAEARQALWQVAEARGIKNYVNAKEGGRVSLERLRKGELVKPATARRIAQALELPYSLLFATHREERCLSSRTIMNCHLVISIVLGQAEKEMRIPLNPAHRASPPKREASDPNYFQMEEVAKILKALEAEPIKWRTAVHLLLVSGCRRGSCWDSSGTTSTGRAGKSTLTAPCSTPGTGACTRAPPKRGIRCGPSSCRRRPWPCWRSTASGRRPSARSWGKSGRSPPTCSPESGAAG